MKQIKIFSIVLVGLFLASCARQMDLEPQGGTLLEKQVQLTNTMIPSRVDAVFNGMFSAASEPLHIPFSSSRPDNFGFAMMDFSNDLEAADISTSNNDYNWFSTCMEFSSRNADYANPYIRYKVPYDIIATANTVISSYPADASDPIILAKIAQAKAMRAYSYLRLAPYYQFTYAIAKDKPCVPLVTEEPVDFTHNPRATVGEVYAQIISDLDYAVEKLQGYTRPVKSEIDLNVALGLRARAKLDMQDWQGALEDATAAAEGYTPATLAELTNPDYAARYSFKDISEHNWLWGYDMNADLALTFRYATPSAWVRSTSAWSYSAGTQTYACINNLLWNKIPEGDIRKQWWVDEDLQSTLLNGLAWPGFSDVANADDGGDTKYAFTPYTSVKFGTNTMATTANDEDWPYMRVEELILIQAECQARLGQTSAAINTLEGFVKGNRYPEYSASGLSGEALLNEIWFQRRVELWGEGFANSDLRRLQKPLVRFHKGQPSNFPDAFQINIAPDDGWMLLRFCTDEMNTNLSIVDNTEGKAPVMGQNGDLRDGVTDSF